MVTEQLIQTTLIITIILTSAVALVTLWLLWLVKREIRKVHLITETLIDSHNKQAVHITEILSVSSDTKAYSGHTYKILSKMVKNNEAF